MSILTDILSAVVSEIPGIGPIVGSLIRQCGSLFSGGGIIGDLLNFPKIR